MRGTVCGGTSLFNFSQPTPSGHATFHIIPCMRDKKYTAHTHFGSHASDEYLFLSLFRQWTTLKIRCISCYPVTLRLYYSVLDQQIFNLFFVNEQRRLVDPRPRHRDYWAAAAPKVCVIIQRAPQNAFDTTRTWSFEVASSWLFGTKTFGTRAPIESCWVDRFDCQSSDGICPWWQRFGGCDVFGFSSLGKVFIL